MQGNFQRYFPSNPSDEAWGVSVSTIGWQHIGPGDPYPADSHPESHRLNDTKGRILDESQLLLITNGRGQFWSERSGSIDIESGNMFFNFKGVRHRYRPDPAVGWDEYWVGLKGPYIERLMEACFHPDHPSVHVGNDPDFVRLYQESFDLAKVNNAGHGSIIATKALQILAKAHATTMQSRKPESFHEETIQEACCLMHANIESDFSSSDFANANGMSLTSFRRHFKLVTGASPIQYLLDLRFRKAQTLLANTNLSVKAIALDCGFKNALYFSRFYKNRTGKAPTNSRP